MQRSALWLAKLSRRCWTPRALRVEGAFHETADLDAADHSIKIAAASLSIIIPQIQAPWANYVSVVVSGSLVYLSGQLPSLDGVLVKGKLGAELSVDDGRKAARMCALNMLPHLRVGLCFRIVRGKALQHADAPHALGLLCLGY
jgi:hypothetical protein